MKYFPITILDDFYENPDEILKLAKEVDYQREGENTYPGCVSNLTVDKINYNLFFYTMKKIISIYWEGECNESKNEHYQTYTDELVLLMVTQI